MPLDQSEAIVLRNSAIGDQDKIVVFFCKEKGIVRGVAKGAKKFGNRFGSGLEPMSVVKIFYYEKEHRDLVTISACDLIESFFEVQAEPDTAFLLSYLTELVEEFSPPHAKDEILFRLLHSILTGLKEGGDRRFLAAYFEAWVLHLNGFLPDLGRCRKCRKAVRESWLSERKDGAYCPDCAPRKKEEVPGTIHGFLHWIKKNPPPGPGETPLPPEEIAKIRKALQAMIVYHLEREPKTLRFLK
jgi:DNA repair protein RecO (recombination protein O)